MKSHVTLEQAICIVCGHNYDTGALLLDTRLRERFEMKTVTGTGLCPKCKELHETGFIALVAIDPDGSHIQNGRVKELSDACRTGDILHVKRTAFGNIFNVPVPVNDKGEELPMCYVSQDVVEMLKEGAVDERE